MKDEDEMKKPKPLPNGARSEFVDPPLNAEGQAKARVIAGRFSALLYELEEFCGVGGREMAIVRTHLQDASFYATRAMAMRPSNQQQ